VLHGEANAERQCVNPKCILAQEHYLPPRFVQEGGHTLCEYCEERALKK
jgi:aspartate carbamoyltransferase regulatory subunit